MQADTPKLSTRLRHVDIHRHWLRQEVQNGKIHTKWIPTAEMPADGLTKSLTRQKHERFINLLHLVDIAPLIWLQLTATALKLGGCVKDYVKDYAVPIVYSSRSVLPKYASVRTDAYSGKAPSLIPEASTPLCMLYNPPSFLDRKSRSIAQIILIELQSITADTSPYNCLKLYRTQHTMKNVGSF